MTKSILYPPHFNTVLYVAIPFLKLCISSPTFYPLIYKESMWPQVHETRLQKYDKIIPLLYITYLKRKAYDTVSRTKLSFRRQRLTKN